MTHYRNRLDNVDIGIEAKRAAAATAIMNLLEKDEVPTHQVLGVLAFAAASFCLAESRMSTKTCIDRQGVLFMTDFLWYLEQNHSMALDLTRDKPEDKGAKFMTELRRPGPDGPIDV